LKNIDLEAEVEEDPTPNKKRAVNSEAEDKLLIQTWLNISKDAMIGTHKKDEGFWSRITNKYNDDRGLLLEKKSGQLKFWWQKINAAVQKFVGCYGKAVHLQ
jgi:hypothetical protein